MKTTKTNMYFYITIAIVVVVIVITGVEGTLQIAERKSDYEKSMKSIENIKNGENIEKSIINLDNIEEKYGQIYEISIEKVNGYMYKKDYKSALNEFEECFETNEEIRSDPYYIYFYGKLSYLNENKEIAKKSILKARELGVLEDNEITEKDRQLIEYIIKE